MTLEEYRKSILENLASAVKETAASFEKYFPGRGEHLFLACENDARKMHAVN